MAEILPATLNHEAFDLGIASESHQKAIGISRFDADPNTPGNQAFDFIFDAAFSGVGQVRYEKNAAAGHTLVQADLDGDGTADFEVELTALIDLAAGDFLL